MKKIIYLFLCLVTLAGCKSEYGTYDGDSIVYLVADYPNDKNDTTKVSFTYINQDSTYVPVSFQLKTMSKSVNYDREINLKIESNGEEGKDFDVVERVQILPAGTLSKTFVVNLRRSDILQSQERKISLEVTNSKDFTVLYNEWHNSGDTISTTKHTIIYSEFMDEAPKTWSVSHFGVFSAKKFITMCNEMNISREKFLDNLYMTTGRKNFVKAEMIKILNAAKEAGNTIYEADGVTEMKMG